MKEVTLDEARKVGLDGIINNRLILIAGAGLSMASPSNLPSAAIIAANAKKEYDGRFLGIKPPLPLGIEDQAEFFFQNNELGIYLKEYVDQDVFAGRFNAGHHAVADLLLSRGLQAVVTTNVDILIEAAGQDLLGQIFTGIDGVQVAAPAVGTAPMLKLHGCWLKEREHTIWAKGQLTATPVKERIERSEIWLRNALLDKDLLIVGYSTDWDYLNDVIAQTMGAASPASVLIVDPSTTSDFEKKAPDLTALAGRANKGAFHLRLSGSDFLDKLRLDFSKAFVRRAIAKGVQTFESLNGFPPSAASMAEPDIDNESYWRVRRDLLGCTPNKPARQPAPYDEPAIGLTILQIREAGGTSEGPFWKLNGNTVRIIRGSGSFIHTLEGEYRWDMPPISTPDIVVAVGADDAYLPSHLTRQADGSITRGAGPRWMTRTAFEGTL
ncbi:SIR2 family protein [Bradyrhizobium sp. LB13.1]